MRTDRGEEHLVSGRERSTGPGITLPAGGRGVKPVSPELYTAAVLSSSWPLDRMKDGLPEPSSGGAAESSHNLCIRTLEVRNKSTVLV